MLSNAQNLKTYKEKKSDQSINVASTLLYYRIHATYCIKKLWSEDTRRECCPRFWTTAVPEQNAQLLYIQHELLLVPVFLIGYALKILTNHRGDSLA